MQCLDTMKKQHSFCFLSLSCALTGKTFRNTILILEKEVKDMSGKRLSAAFLLVVLVSFFLLSSVPAGAFASGIGAGYRFLFGSFEQDCFLSNGKEPIVWRVLDVDEASGNVLAVSEFGLYTAKYHRNNKKTSWGDTDVRNWLNSAFLATFSEEERQQIAVTSVSGSDDWFFLLDADQITQYLSYPYLCFATPWALENGEDGAYVNEDTGASSWLVRTDVAEKRIAWVGGGGKLYSPQGKNGVNYLNTKDNVVRPAMWIRKEACMNEATQYGFPVYARTKERLSTRSGPTTGYCGLGDYFSKGGELVRVLSRVHDGSIWWLEIEFEYDGLLVRCYTGWKRISVNIDRIPDDPAGNLGSAYVLSDAPAFYGPGSNYKQMPSHLTPSAGTEGTVVKQENGWYCFEYRDDTQTVRVWLPAEALLIG